MEEEKETFIDIDNRTLPVESYEQLVLKQIQKCVDVLSKEIVGGMTKTKTTKRGQEEVYIEDVRHLIINSVETLRALMLPFIESEEEKSIKEIKEEINKFKEGLNEKVIFIQGKGNVTVKDLKFVPPDFPLYKEFYNIKANKYREMFEILIMVYKKNKQEIKVFSKE